LLVLRVGGHLCGVPLSDVAEVCRPVPTKPLPGTPLFVLGVAILRARPTPVVDARRLLGQGIEEAPTRYVSLKLGAERPRVVALAVDAVVGIREVSRERLDPLPGVLGGAEPLLQSLGALDGQLFMLLEHARLLPEALWAELERERATA
jgi:purine-binding chemotaxis protein CheW